MTGLDPTAILTTSTLWPALATLGAARSPAAAKLIECMAAGIGRVADLPLVPAQAFSNAIADRISDWGHATIQERADARDAARRLREQRNIEAVLVGTAAQVVKLESVSADPVDSDWIEQFFDYAGQVSDAEMQSLWSRLLAGELEAPGRFSLRTLEIVRTLRKQDAQLFTSACRFTVLTSSGYMLPVDGSLADHQKQAGVGYGELLRLADYGLLTPNTITLDVTPPEDLAYFGDVIPTMGGPGSLSAIRLSQAAQELVPLSGATADSQYFALLKHELAHFNA